MKVSLIADSCFLFECDGIRILTDPWIGTTIYGGAWMQFPKPTIKPDEVGRLDYIFISHIHEDHCCPDTISHLDKNAKVIIMDKSPNYVMNFLKYHDFNFSQVITLKPRELFKINDSLSVEVVEADPKHELNYLIDSSLIIHYYGKSIYFANDNPPYPEIYDYLRRYNFQLALIPPAGGSGYPAFYENLTSQMKKEKAKEILSSYQKTMLECLRAISPKYFLCSASSHVLSGKNALSNYYMAWYENANLPYKFLSENTNERDGFMPILISPGQTIDLDSNIGVSYEEAILYYDNKKERDEFIANSALRQFYCYDYLKLSPSVKFEYLFELAHKRLRENLEKENMELDWAYQILFQKKRLATISLRRPYNISFDKEVKDDKRLLMKIDDRMLFLLLTGAFSWNIADASGFIIYNRKPDEYIYSMYIMLNHLRI